MKKFFNKKKFKFGGYAVVMTIGVVVIVFLLNFLLVYLDNNFNLSIDLTANKVYSLTMQTEHVLDSLSQDVYIYQLGTQDYEDKTVNELLERYKNGSKYIHVESINIVTNPGAVSYYEKVKDVSVSTGNIIVSTSADTTDPKQSFKLLDLYDLYSYDSQTESMSLFTGEDALTGAILYVQNPDIPKIWFLDGHGTTSSNWAEMSSYLEDENYDVGSVSLLTEPEKLEKGDILIVLAPSEDLSNDERETLLDFALDGGKIMFLFDPLSSADIPNFMLVLSFYNLSLEEGLVFEDVNNTDAYFYDVTYLVPTLLNNSITNPIKSSSYSLMVPQTGAIAIGPDQTGIDINILMESSDDAYLEPIDGDMDGVKNENALMGPFPLAVTATKDATEETEEVKMVIVSSSVMFSQISAIQAIGNYEMFLNTVSWLSPVDDDFYIRGKSLKTSVLYFENNAQINTVVVIVCIIIPLLAFVGALVVYLKRRHL